MDADECLANENSMDKIKIIGWVDDDDDDDHLMSVLKKKYIQIKQENFV